MCAQVVHLISTLQQSGPVTVLYNLLKNVHNEIDTSVLTLSSEPSSTMWPEYEAAGILVDTLSMSRLESIIYSPWRLRRRIASINPDIVHTHGFRPDLLANVLPEEVTVVSTFHNYPFHDYPYRYGQYRGQLLSHLHTSFIGRIDQPVGCSEFVTSKISRYNEHAITIRNGTDPEQYSPVTEKESQKIRAQLGLPIDEPIFISVGKLSKIKDPKTVIKGFKRADIDGTLLLLGTGEQLKECRSISNSNVRLEGFVDNVSKYLRSADYYISASRFEGLPNAVMEALSSGIPVCLSDIGPHREILRINTHGGTLFEVRSPDSLARKLETLRTDGSMVAQDAARSIVTNQLNYQRMGSEYAELYDRLLEEGSPAY